MEKDIEKDLISEIYVFSDIEIGAGTLTDDFISDNLISEELLKLSKSENRVDLIFAGDTFDFLKCPQIIKKKVTYPRHITEEISIHKLELMYKAHKKFFNAISKFLKNKNNHVHFLVGNHDFDLWFKGVQNMIKYYLKSKNRVHFPGLHWIHPSGVFVTHGHIYDDVNIVEKKFEYYNGQKILNLPWLCFAQMTEAVIMKEEHPFMERVYPREVLFSKRPDLLKRLKKMCLKYLSSSLYYQIRYYNDPTHYFPLKLVPIFYKRMKNTDWDFSHMVDIFIKSGKEVLKENKMFVSGHIHEYHQEVFDGKTIIHIGSWRDEYKFDEKNQNIVPIDKGYLKIKVVNEKLIYETIKVSSNRKPISFKKVSENELSVLKLADKQELYKKRKPKLKSERKF